MDFKTLFMREPIITEQGIYCFSPKDEGDYFDESDIESWRNGRLEQNWNQTTYLENKASRHLVDEIIQNSRYVIDLACGPGMGLIPSIKQLAPHFPCLASDANPFVLQEWKQYLHASKTNSCPEFAQFSALDLPFQNNSVQAFSSFIGLSSTHNDNAGYDLAVSEIHRTLVNDGMLYTIENEWNDIPAILNLFEKMNMQPWTCFLENQISWHDRFINFGFDIVYEEPYLYRNLQANDNELGEAAARFGVDIGLQFTSFILRKKG